MQYMLLIHIDEAAMAAAAPAGASNAATYEMMASYAAYNDALIKAGAMVSGDRLKPAATGTVVRVRGDRTEVADGPFAETKEQLGGFYIIEAADLDAAIAWASRCPAASTGTIEVRPIWPRA